MVDGLGGWNTKGVVICAGGKRFRSVEMTMRLQPCTTALFRQCTLNGPSTRQRDHQFVIESSSENKKSLGGVVFGQASEDEPTGKHRTLYHDLDITVIITPL
jgi:hypothetical protein